MLKGFHLALSLKIITNTQATINRKEKTLSAKTRFSLIQVFGSRTTAFSIFHGDELVLERLYHISIEICDSDIRSVTSEHMLRVMFMRASCKITRSWNKSV